MTWAEHFSVWNEPGGIIEMQRGQEHDYMMAYSQFLAQQRKPPEQVGNPWRHWQTDPPPAKWVMTWDGEEMLGPHRAQTFSEIGNRIYWRLA